ncbi:two-component sensor histidine kinase [Streptosporangium nondiastaticum]|uniref:histidine kinase n=1 Tax=Streptosporangium nondiastaticum TaxID=35764 RepID=A0A9X7JUG9_9ACTN|nr:two-component sensor histidine kinase [Streptosporangium nondiastaticum]
MPSRPAALILVSVSRTHLSRPFPDHCRPPGVLPGAAARTAAETAGVVLAGLGVWGAVAGLGFMSHPSLQLPALAAGAVLFTLRHRFPVAVLLVLAVLTGPAPCVGPVTAATSYAVARRTVRARRRGRLLVAAAALVVVCATVPAPWLGPGPVPYGLALGLILTPTTVLVPGLVGTSYGQQRRLVQALRERGDAAERARRFADSEARIHERSRIAAEMHDLVGHRLSLISLHAGGLELALERADPELREEAVLVRRTTRDAMRELRQALGVLGPLGRDTGAEALTDATGTRADIETLVAESRDGGIAVRLDWTGPDLDARPAPVRRAVHRVVRESLTNVHRYASAAHVTVTVVHDHETVRVTVRNGAPPAPPAAAGSVGTGRGLTGLRERVELLGGTFDASSLPSGGFQVDAIVPAEPGDAPAPERPGTADTGPEDGGTGPERGKTAAEAGEAAAGGGVAPGRRTAHVLTLALGLVTLSVLMALGITFVYASAPHQFAGPRPLPRIGMTYGDVTEVGVLDNKAVRAAATGHEPPRPAGTVGCVYPFNGATEIRPGALKIARYCFDASQRLIAIDRFTVPSVRDATPWETP